MKLTIFFIMFLFSNPLVAEEIQANNELPTEMKLLINSYNQLSFSTIQKNTFLSILNLLQENIKYLDKANSYILIKSEIYKEALQNPPRKVRISDLNNEYHPKTFKNKIDSPFYNWLINALYQDYIKLKSEHSFQKLFKQRTLSGKHRVLKKKLERVVGWLKFYKDGSKETVEDYIKNFTINLISKLNFYAQTFSGLSSINKIQNDTYKIYSFTQEEVTQEKTNEQDISQILEEPIAGATKITEPEDMTGSKVIKDTSMEWKPSKDEFELFPKPDPNYVPPANLPEPTDDWILDL